MSEEDCMALATSYIQTVMMNQNRVQQEIARQGELQQILFETKGNDATGLSLNTFIGTYDAQYAATLLAGLWGPIDTGV